MNSPRIVIAIDIDYFYAQCEEIRKPELKTKPVVVCVYSGRSETSGAVSTANYAARKIGIKSGISIASARRLLENHRESVFLPMDREYYDSVSERIMRLIDHDYHKFEQVSVDEAFIDVTNDARNNYENAISIAKKIKGEILDSERMTCTVGIGPNKTIAKMAADASKPDGLLCIRAEQSKIFLQNMPVGKLIGVGPKNEEKLKGLGVSTIGELSEFPTEKLSEVFGKNQGPHLKNLARGIDDDPVLERPMEQLSRIITLKEDVTSFSFGDELVPLVRDLSKKLSNLGLKCKIIGILAITSQLRVKTKARTLGVHTDSSDDILLVSKELFHDFFLTNSDKDISIRRIGIRVSGFTSIAQKKEEDDEGKSDAQETLTDFL